MPVACSGGGGGVGGGVWPRQPHGMLNRGEHAIKNIELKDNYGGYWNEGVGPGHPSKIKELAAGSHKSVQATALCLGLTETFLG